MGRLKDISGKTYGYITVINRVSDRVYENGRRKVFWNCLCKCGNTKVIAGDNLKQGQTKSCGCSLYELKETLVKKYPSEYNSYRAMRDRVRSDERYLIKGITCEWTTFDDFLSDMGEKPDSSYTIDREDTQKGYYKGNCRWASKAEQAYNCSLYKTNSSGFVGVAPLRGKYQAYIGFKGKTIYIGLYDNIEQAVHARKQAEVEYYGYNPNRG